MYNINYTDLALKGLEGISERHNLHSNTETILCKSRHFMEPDINSIVTEVSLLLLYCIVFV